MRTTNQNHIKQRNLFFEPSALPGKSSVPLFTLPEDTKPRRVNHMAKFKAFHEFQKPLIGFTPETFPHFHEDMFRLCRNGNPQRPLMQGSQRGRGSIFTRYRRDRSQIFVFRSANVSSEVTVKFIVLWICNRSSQQ